ncbi:hypothetical protein HRH25_16220 [Flavisolibacter sp. BT320]|nr:hypothetical protein [Flavisolibacter longurius]
MKKTLFNLACLFMLAVSANAQGLYNQTINSIDGQSVRLHKLMYKKILFVVVPLTQTHPVYQQLQAFHQRYGDSVQIVGIPSFEDGYKEAQAATVKQLYQGLGIMLAEGMYTRKTSPGQSALFQWLTNNKQNWHFNYDARGIGSKFFVSEIGKLFAVLPPEASLQLPVVNKIVQRKEKK